MLRLFEGDYAPADVSNVTHIEICLPGPMPHRILPVVVGTPKRESSCWEWDGNTEAPTLSPSILTRFTRTKSGEEVAINERDIEEMICHPFITNGKVQYLDDCTHQLAGKTLDLLPID